MLFVCTNARKPGERISCAGEGRCGEELLQKLKTYVKTHRLENQVRVAKSGCQEKCEMGPNVILLPQNELLSDVSMDNLNEIIETYF